MSRIARGAATALAVIGVALLVLQPVCAAAEHQDFSADSCCASLDVAPVVAAPSAFSAVGERVALVPHPAQVAQTRGAPYFLEAGPLAASPLPPLRYYARSARILR